MTEIQLGKGRNNAGIVDTTRFKGGIKKEQLENEEQKAIFDMIDTDKNGVLDENEIQKFKEQLETTAGNEKLSKREAGRLLKQNNLKNINKKEVFQFVNQLAQSSENIEQSQVLEENGQKTIIITYKDGSQETINPDKTTQIATTDLETKAVTTKFYDENKALTQESVVQQNGDSEVTTFADNQPQQKTITLADGTKTTVIDYKDGKEATSTVTEGATTSTFEYIDGKPRLAQKVIKKGADMTDEIKYGYNEDGVLTTEGTKTYGSDGKVIYSKLVQNKGAENEQTTTNELVNFGLSTKTTVINKNGEAVYLRSVPEKEGEEPQLQEYNIKYSDGSTKKMYKGSNDQTVVVKKDKDGNEVYEEANPDGSMIRARFTPKKGKFTEIKYDGKGNSELTVQIGETPESMANTFGCSVDDLKALNKGKKFTPGSKVLVPGEFNPASEAITQRKSVDEMIHQVQQQETANRKNYFRQLGVTDFSKYGQKVKLADDITYKRGRYVTDTDSNGNKTQRFIAASDDEAKQGTMKINGEVVAVETYRNVNNKGNYTIVGKLGDAPYYMVKDNESGNIYYADNDLTSLVRTDSVNNKRYFNQHKAERGKGRVQGDFLYVKTGQKDKFGNDIIVTGNGYQGYLKNGKVYWNYQDRVLYGIETGAINGKTIVGSAAQNRLDNANSSLSDYEDNEGWIGKAVDSMGDLWNSDNTKEKVRKDIQNYTNQLKELQKCKTDAEFKAKFKQVFGIDYNGEAMAEYFLHQDDKTYQRAFGDKNNIAKRVQKYIHSQNVGTTFFKGGVLTLVGVGTVATGGGLGAVSVATGGTSMLLSGTDKATSKKGLSINDIPSIALEGTIDGATTFVGGKGFQALGEGTKELIKGTGKVASMGRGAVMTTIDAATIGSMTYAGAGPDADWSDYASAALLYGVGKGTAMLGGRTKAPTTNTKSKTTLDVATSDGTRMPGGKLGAPKFEQVKLQTQNEIPTATPQRAAQIHQEAHQLQGQSRPQGREIKHIVENGVGYLEIGKRRIPLDTATPEQLQAAKKSVQQWTASSRDKQAILNEIDNQLYARMTKNKPTSTRASETVDNINTQMQRNAGEILSGKKGGIGSHDAATLRDHITNNLNTVEELEGFIGSLKNRVGTDSNGKMHVYQVEGQDHAAALMKQAQTKINNIKAHNAELNTVTGQLDSAIAANKGLSGDDLATARAFMDKSNSVSELETLIAKMNKKPITRSNAARKLISDMQAKVDMLKAKQIATSSAQTNAHNIELYETPASTNQDRTADFAAAQRDMITRGELGADGLSIKAKTPKPTTQPETTPEIKPTTQQQTPTPEATPAATPQNPSYKNTVPAMAESGIQIENTVGHRSFASDKGLTADFAATQRKMMGNGELRADGTKISTTNEAEIAGGFFGKSAPKTVELTPEKGWQNFNTTEGGVTVVNSNGKIYLGKTGSTKTTQVKLNIGETRTIGKTRDGLEIVLMRNENGYSVIHTKPSTNSQSTFSSFIDRIVDSVPYFRSTQPKTGTISTTKIKSIVEKGIKTTKANDPGTPHMSTKLRTAMEDTTPLVKELGDNIDLNNISQYIKPGEVCTVGTGNSAKLYVNDNGIATELKLSKQKFEELFPKTGMGLVQQDGLNNCWLVSRLNSMTSSSTGKAQLYSMFEELPNGNVLVKLKGSKYPIEFQGGKPADVKAAKLGEGAAPGLEMVQQAVLTRVIETANTPRITNIKDLSSAKLQDATGALSHSDKDATLYLFGSSKTPTVNPATTKSQLEYITKLEDSLNSFANGQDMGIATWQAHQRDIVGYNPQTKMVTYHDPYYGGVDLTCTLSEFAAQNPSLTIIKAKTGSQISSQTVSRQQTPQLSQTNNTTTAQSIEQPTNTTPRRSTIREERPATQTQARPTLEIPAGAKLVDTPTIWGKPRRRIQLADGSYCIETNGKWQKM